MSQSKTDKTQLNGKQGPDLPDPEVVPTAKRRRFSAAYKLRILEEADSCTERGQIGALLRREGLYHSHLSSWRRQRAKGQLAGLKPRKRGRKVDPQAKELARLQRENERLRAELERAETIIGVQKKLSTLFGQPTAETEPDDAK